MRFSIVNFSIMMLCCWCTAPQETAGASNFAKSCLYWHNQYRRLCGVPPLELDAELSKVSTRWANTLARNNEFKHSHGKYGENLYSAWGSSSTYKINGGDAVRAWYSEKKFYTWKDYKNGPSSDVAFKAGHYTQVVWKNSKKLGVGLARTLVPNNGGVRYIVVCNYSPAGNFIGHYPKNVFPPRPSTC